MTGGIHLERIVHLKGGSMQHPGSAHAHLREMLHLPGYYGENLDALFDCLTEITEPTVLCISQWDKLFPALRQVLLAAERENDNIQIKEEEP